MQCTRIAGIVRRNDSAKLLNSWERRSMKLQGKVAIITGAGRGIGQATAIKFATEGAKVVVCDLSLEQIKETVEMCKETRGDAMGYVADVRDIKSLEEKVPLGRLGRPEEIANTFAWLASDEASYINGAVIEVSGGLTI